MRVGCCTTDRFEPSEVGTSIFVSKEIFNHFGSKYAKCDDKKYRTSCSLSPKDNKIRQHLEVLKYERLLLLSIFVSILHPQHTSHSM